MKKATSKLLLFFFCMSFLMVIPKKVNAAENHSGQLLGKIWSDRRPKDFDMINEREQTASMHGVGRG